MTRFRALNESTSESEDDNEEKETKEAQEERAFAQYNHGLFLQSQKKFGEAEEIYTNLLQCPFLEQVTGDSADGSDSLVRPAAALKYGCLKNLGEVLVKRGNIQEGLDCYLEALDLDNSDVTMWHRAGKVALMVKRLDLARYAFQQALRCNPRYWPSLDALIPVLYALGDALGCIVLCYRALHLDRGYPLARAFCARILKEQPSLTEYLDALDIDSCDIAFGDNDDSEELVKVAEDLQTLWRESEKDFPQHRLSGLEDKPLTVPVSSPSWLAVGKALLQLYRRIASSDPAVSFLNLAKMELASSESAANSKGSTPPSGSAAPEGESDTDAEEQTEEDATEASGQEQEDLNKMGGRKRRRSSISLLDSYKRRSMRVRNGVRREQEKEDTSLADALRSLLPPSLHITSIETESESEKRKKDVRRLADALAWGDDSDDAALELCRLLEQRENETGQTQANQSRHDTLAKKLKEEGYFGTERESNDVIAFIESDQGIVVDFLTSFLRRLSSLSSLTWPVGLSRVYTDVYQYFRCHVHQPPTFSSSISTEDLKTDAELTLLYSELFLDRVMQNNKHSSLTPCQHVEEGIAHIVTFVGRPDLIGSPAGRRLILRGMWIKVLYSLHRDDSPSAIHTLKDIIYFIENFIGEEDLKYKESTLPLKDDMCSETSSKPVNTSEEKTDEIVELPKDTTPEISLVVKPGNDDVETTEAVPKVESLNVSCAEEKMDVDNNQLSDVVDPEKAAATEKAEMTRELKELARIQSEFSVVLPNCVNNYVISKMSVQRLLTNLTRKQQLKKMEKLYDSGQFSELVDMLADCFKFCAQQVDSGSDNEEFENLPDRPTQMAMLLDSLWKLERYNDCVFWAEACVHEAHGRYLNTSEENREQQVWATVVENILLGMDKCLSLSPTQSLKALPRARMSRLVQTLSSLLCHQLDQQDSTDVPVECTTAWLLIYRVTRFEESNLNEEENALMPRSLLVLFTAHDHMAKRGWCSQGEGRLLLAILDGVLTHLRRPELAGVREEMTHQAEQAIFCLFKHPQKAKEQGRKRYLQDHKVPSQLTLTLDRAMQLLEFVRPDELPQFDSVADASIDADCEALLKRIVELIPQELKPPKAREELGAYIKGQTDSLPQTHYSLPPRATDLLYLLADYYCKRNKEKNKTAIEYFVEDLCANPFRFDSWASMCLVRSAKLSTKLNSCDRLNVDEMLAEMSEAKRCFQRALELNENNMIIIEFGSFAYCMHSYCSRLLKADPNDTNVDMFDEMLSQASKCFTTASKTDKDERWLPEYMLGKIAEKRGEEPATFLRHYQMAAMLLDESGAEYPRTLEYDSKLRLACEAHEVHYRIHASILKQLLHSRCRPLDTATYELYRCCLAKFAEGPFMKSAGHVVAPLKELLQVRGSFQPSARSKPAKVHHAKRKSSDKSGDETTSKKIKVEAESGVIAIPKQENNVSELTGTVTESKPAESITVEGKPLEGKPTEDKPAEDKLTESKPAESMSTESKPVESKPVESKLVESKLIESNLVERQPADSNPADVKPVEGKSTESKVAGETSDQIEPQAEVKKEPTSSNNATSSSSSASSSSESSSDSESSSGSSSDSSDSGSSSDSSDSEESSDSSATEDENKTSAKTDAENQEGAKGKTAKEVVSKSSEKLKSSPPTESFHDVGPLVRACLYAMEECLLRYPRHYKSLYRLAHYYFSPGEHRDLDKCWQLLLGKYYIERANRYINGLFKSDNFRTMFSDIWRIQSEDVDRAGNFAAHMSSSVLLVLQLLREKRDHRRLIQLAAYLYKDPESARSKYLRDNERKELAQQAVEMCIMVVRNAVPETNSVDSLMDIFSTVSTALNINPEIPRSSAETFRAFLCDAFKNAKDLKSTSYEAAFDFCRREKAARKRQAAAEAAAAAAAEAALQASLQLQLAPAVSSSQAPAASSSPHLPTVTISKVASNPLTPSPSRFPVLSTPWTGMSHAPLAMAGKVGRPPKKPALPSVPAPSAYGPGRMSVEQLLMSMGMNLNDLPYSATSVQQGMNLLAQIQQPQPQFRPQQPPKPKPKVAPVVSNIVKDRPGISITPLQAGGPRKQFNLPPRNQLLVEPVKGVGPVAGPSPQALWPGAPRGRAAQHTPRGGISVVPASRLLKPPGTEALSRHNQLVVTPRPRGRPPNPLNAGRGRPRLSPQSPWLGMNLPLGGVSPGAPTAMRPGRPPSPRSHAHAVALARAQVYHDLEQAKQRAKQQMQQQPRQQFIRPTGRLPVTSTATAPVATVAVPSSSAAVLDPEIITLE